MARKYGAIPLESENGSYEVSLRSLTDGHGPDVVLEVVGNPAAHTLAIELVRIGGIVSSCGVHSAALTIGGDVAYNKNLKFCFGRCHVRAMFPEALSLLQKIGTETPELLDEFVQKKVSIEEAPEVSGSSIVAMFEPKPFPTDPPICTASSITAYSTNGKSARSFSSSIRGDRRDYALQAVQAILSRRRSSIANGSF